MNDAQIKPARLSSMISSGLGVKLALLGAGSVLVTAAALVIIAIWQSGQYNNLAQKEVEYLISTDLDHISQGVYNLVYTENEAVQHQVDYNLNVASHVFTRNGDITLSRKYVNWVVTNQLSNESSEISLPRFTIGGNWIGKNDSLSEKTPIVDDVRKLVGETSTIFQRMNENGDMLRIATNVETSEKTRAIGTYIPAINPDGTANPVISDILRGQTYNGRAYVVDQWYLTAYKPLYDVNGDLVGMINVGIKHKTVEERIRHAILQTRVGKTGYVYVLGGSGEEKGKYIISNKGERDKEDIWSIRDSDGRYVIREIIESAIALKNNEMTTVRYRWQNPGESSPRWKIARIVYFAPWDWVIGISVYEDELQTYRTWLSNGRRSMVNIMGFAGIIITFVTVMICVLITLKITQPVKEMTVVAKKIMAGDLEQVIDVKNRDEIGILAGTFNLMTRKLKETLDNLTKSEMKYRGIFENAIEGLFQNGLDGSILSVNPAMARIMGYDSPEEMISNVKDVKSQLYVRPEERDILINKLNKHGKVFEFEVQLYRKNRQKIWASISARLVYSDFGTPLVIEGFVSNISARRKAEEDLEESVNYLHEIMNAVGDPLFVKDSEHKFVLVNDAMCEFIGKSRDELIGKTDREFFNEEEANIFRSNEDSVLNSGIPNIEEENFTDKDGLVRIVFSKKTLYRDKNGNRFIVGLLRDVTEQKEAEEEKLKLEARLVQSQKMEAIGTLAGGIAHDFNNILSIIIGYTELSLHQIKPSEKAESALREVLKAGERAKDLVKQILTFSRMKKSDLSPVSIENIINDSLKMIRSFIPTTIEIRKKISASGKVFSNPTQLNQIMLNLCSNASHSMDKTGGVLEIGLEKIEITGQDMPDELDLEPGDYFRITVSDTGKGIPEEIMERIFEPYFTTRETGGGTGLGLSVIHGIVKSHNGTITCRNNPDGGALFEIYLPETRTGEPDTAEVGKHEIIKGNERILFIDDEKPLVLLISEILVTLGYHVETSESSIEALEMFRTDPLKYDLIITDMTMPDMTGDRLAKEMIEIRKDIPIIICTGYNEHINRKSAKSLGIKEFLMKPVNMHTLSEAVRRALNKRKQDDSKKA